MDTLEEQRANMISLGVNPFSGRTRVKSIAICSETLAAPGSENSFSITLLGIRERSVSSARVGDLKERFLRVFDRIIKR